ncbi:uncharacterized protein LOC132045172 [Lycium ferocissimum]|uniref:uncharacterized protein LOC132045172 n=1 Tax=Lycium ferocissimum TaxID=112874 RepID=UPI002815FAA5|nr:uncharacterized protein LOC132045172 [Lycium ferocissimum]
MNISFPAGPIILTSASGFKLSEILAFESRQPFWQIVNYLSHRESLVPQGYGLVSICWLDCGAAILMLTKLKGLLSLCMLKARNAFFSPQGIRDVKWLHELKRSAKRFLE